MSPETEPDNEESTSIPEQVVALVCAIPAGRVMSYGALGARCEPPISGYVCGRIMQQIRDAPWWRVVAKDGRLVISKRAPQLAQEQHEKLESEGVAFDEESRVLMSVYAME